MIEKVNPSHPDKVADRIAGAIVDYAYTKDVNPKVAVEVLIGHGCATIINETNVKIELKKIQEIVNRIAGIGIEVKYVEVPQDIHLSNNQSEEIRCGDNGIFKGVPLTIEERTLADIARKIYEKYKSDGKYILDGHNLIICQSNAKEEDLRKEFCKDFPNAKINPLGFWVGGTNVDSGATNRKLGSDMAQSVTGGGLHGKDLSKADVSLNIYAFMKAQELNKAVEFCCAIGDTKIDDKPYKQIVEEARQYIKKIGGFEKFAEWGLF